MGLLVHLVFFCFYLLVWGINIVKGFTTFSATVLALTFVFGNSARSVFEVRAWRLHTLREPTWGDENRCMHHVSLENGLAGCS
jgi:hypothetical protein